MKHALVVTMLITGCRTGESLAPTSPPPAARRPVPRPEKPKVVRSNADGTTRPWSYHAIDQSFDLVNLVPEAETLLGMLPREAQWIPGESIRFETPAGPPQIPGGRTIFEFSGSPTHEVKMGGIYAVHLVEGEPMEVDIPGVGTRTFTPWLVESIELPKSQ